jgi:hypothetical protein
MTIFALALGLYIKYVKQVEERLARIGYFCNCVRNPDTVQWVKEPAAKVGFDSHSSDLGKDGVQRGEGEYNYYLLNSTGKEPAECLAALSQHFIKKKIFHDPVSVENFENRLILKSPEGELKMEAKWLPDEPAHTENPKRMQLKWEYEFRPLFPPSEEQKMP